MDPVWLKIRSWHAVHTPTRAINTFVTYCGRRAEGMPVNDRPGGEKSCESCLRIISPK